MRTVQVRGLDKPWSVITFGCWQIAPSGGGGDVCSSEEADRAVKAALAGGITAFDTAEGYGDGESERRLGRALGPRKDDVLIISKIWPDAELTLAAYRERLEGSLRALNREFVDLYLVHWAGDYFDTHDKSQKLCEIMKALRESGKARAIGLSNFESTDLYRLGPHVAEFTVNQVPYNLLQREYEGATLEICQGADIGYMAYSPTGRGLLAGRQDAAALRAPTRQEYHLYQEPYLSAAGSVQAVVQDVAHELGTVPVNVAIAWVLQQPNVATAVVGSRKADQIREFCPAGDLILSEDQLDRLYVASDAFADAVA